MTVAPSSRTDAPTGKVAGGDPCVVKEREVSVVACRFEVRTERRVHETAGLSPCLERDPQQLGEDRGDGRRLPGSGVDPVELAPSSESAERPLARGEETLDRAQLSAGGAFTPLSSPPAAVV